MPGDWVTRKIILEAESLAAVQMVTSPISNTHPLSQLVMNVHHLLNRNRINRVVHVMREANRAIDFCANLGHSLINGEQEIEVLPEGLHQIKKEDAYGMLFLRLSCS